MNTERLSALSDGVIAILITILADALYVLVALMWLIPDRRIEALFNETAGETGL